MSKRRRDGSSPSTKPIPATRRKAAAKWLMVAGMVIGITPSCWAEEVDAGKAEYLSSCAPCHRTDGKGTGPLSSRLKTKPADLTTFAKKNNGVFPLGAVYEAVDGRNATGSHDNREMPIWGCRRTSSPISPTKTVKRKVHKEWSAPFGMDRRDAVQMATCRACSSSNLAGLLYPSAEWRRLAL